VTGFAAEPELAPVGIPVAVCAGRPDAREYKAAVAVATTHLAVGSIEGEAGPVVLEAGRPFDRRPAFGRVALGALEPVVAVGIGAALLCGLCAQVHERSNKREQE